MRISRKKRPDKPLIPRYNKNHHIKAPELMVLDQSGENLGIMSTKDAIEMALEKELDLVEINPKGKPPVAKLLDFADFKYQKEKELKKQKAHSRASETKGIRLSVRIGEHDMQIKCKQTEKFLNRGDKVKIEIIMRGRENARPDLAKDAIDKFIKLINVTVETRIEQEPTKQGRKFTAIIAKK